MPYSMPRPLAREVTIAYPSEFVHLQPYAARCDLIGNDNDCAQFLTQIKPAELQQLVSLYLQLVDQGAKPRLDAWIENEHTADSSEAMRLLVLLDYLARHGYIPEPQASTRFIEWDDREFDDFGNEW
jgi:hypothetical protein